MKKLILFALLSVVVCGCDAEKTGVSVRCGNYNVHMDIAEDGTSLRALIDGKPFDFILTKSASGAKFAGLVNSNDVTFWNKGDIWTMFINEDIVFECK